MKVVRLAINIVAVTGITAGFARLFGSIQLPPWATNLLVRCASFFNIYDAESVEDFYMLSTIVLSLILACVLVWGVNRAITRSKVRTTMG